jgi:hypothetical protein
MNEESDVAVARASYEAFGWSIPHRAKAGGFVGKE